MQVEQPTVYVLDEMINSKTHRIHFHHKWETRWADDHCAGLQGREVWVQDQLCSWEKHFTLTMPLSTQENPVNCHLLGGNLVMDWHPMGGGGEEW